MKKALIIIIAPLVIALWLAVGCGATPQKPVHKKIAKDIEGLIQQLGDDDWETREIVQKKLITIGEGYIQEYRTADDKVKAKDKIEEFAFHIQKVCKSKDPEIKERANQIREHFYLLSSCSKIMFTSYRDGNREVYIVDANGSNQKNLTKNKVYDDNPAWSPDGKRIIFVSWNDNSSGNEIYVMDADGSNKKKLTQNNKVLWEPAWSPDGTKIIFNSISEDNMWEIYIMDADGNNQKRLIHNKKTDCILRPGTNRWSPDGKQIAFDSDRDSNNYTNEIYVMNADGTNLKRLTKNKNADGNPAWSPDGTKIAFVSQRDDNYEIYVMNADGTHQKRLTENEVSDNNPVWSPDGKKIAFVSRRYDDNEGIEIYVMDADGSNKKNLSQNKANDWDPTWSPDGTKIAFISSRDGSFEIYVMNADGSNKKRLTENLDTSPIIDFDVWTAPAWSPVDYYPEIAQMFEEKD